MSDILAPFTARAWLLGNDIDTDIIIPTQYLALPSVQAMAPHAFSPLRPQLAGGIKPGDVIVAGANFGSGSSREQAPEVIRALGVRCVLAESFARIFFRNAVNNGLLVLECPGLHAGIAEGDTLAVQPGVKVSANGRDFPLAPLAEGVLEILQGGGLVAAMRRRNGLPPEVE